MSNTQSSFGGSEVPRIRDLRSVRENGEGCKPEVHADRCRRGRQRLTGRQVKVERRIPLACLTFESKGFDACLSRQRTVPSHLHVADALEIQAIGWSDATPVTPRGPSQGVVTLTRFEARIAGAGARFQSSKERPECSVHTTKYVLAGREVRDTTIARRTDVLELAGLIVVVEPSALRLPGGATLLQGRVLEPTGLIHLRMQGTILGSGRVHAITERPSHSRTSILPDL